MKILATTGGVLLLFSLWSAVVQAQGEIVFAAQRYQKTGKIYKDDYGSWGEMLRDTGSYHLYRINPNGSGQKRLTFGKWDDILPCWSPDGKQIAFIRGKDFEKIRLCVIRKEGGRVRTLVNLPGENYKKYIQWSPDGRFITVSLDSLDAKTYLLSVKNGKKRVLPGVEKCAWSPDGRWLYLCRGTKRAGLLNLHTMRERKINNPVYNPIWLNNETIMGEAGFNLEDEFRARPLGTYLKIVSITDRTLRKLSFHSGFHHDSDEDGEIAETLEDEDERRWQAIPNNTSLFVMQRADRHSNGPTWYCYKVNIRTGIWKPLRHGMLIGVSPEGQKVAVSDDTWMGPYKHFRGGRRVGQIEIVSLKTGTAHKIIRGIMGIFGGDWYHPKRKQPRRVSTAVVRR